VATNADIAIDENGTVFGPAEDGLHRAGEQTGPIHAMLAGTRMRDDPGLGLATLLMLIYLEKGDRVAGD
jgi:hypothetical protein